MLKTWQYHPPLLVVLGVKPISSVILCNHIPQPQTLLITVSPVNPLPETKIFLTSKRGWNLLSPVELRCCCLSPPHPSQLPLDGYFFSFHGVLMILLSVGRHVPDVGWLIRLRKSCYQVSLYWPPSPLPVAPWLWCLSPLLPVLRSAEFVFLFNLSGDWGCSSVGREAWPAWMEASATG